MRLLLLTSVALALATQTFASKDTCSVVTNPAPCGQQSDSQEVCEAKGCCFNAGFKQVPCFYPGYDAVNITTVHVVQSAHFDAGFADTLVNILERWWYQHFPRALALGDNLTALGGAESLRFMTQTWIVSMFKDCPVNANIQCPSATQIAAFDEAVNKGYLYWHSWPENGEMELLPRSMIDGGIALSHALDDLYDVPRKRFVSQRDVPGTTRAVIPHLLRNGIDLITIGVNGASTPPKVPRMFMWKDENSNTTMPTMVHPYGYGGITFEDAIIIPGFDHALVLDWRGDNAGPPMSVEEVIGDWKSIASVFPGASIVASTFDNFTSLFTPDMLARLPVITSEIGDTWLHGAASDSMRTAQLKLGAHALTTCIASGDCDPNSYEVRNFTRFLLKNQEHTWGDDVKTFLHDTTHWTNVQFQEALASNLSNFEAIITSWHEQRNWGLTFALEALPDGHPLKTAVVALWDTVTPPSSPPSPASDGWTAATPGKVYSVGRYNIAFDGVTGAVSTLTDIGGSGVTWANTAVDGSSLGVVEYITFDQPYYTNFLGNYCAVQPPPSWFLLDFGKPNMTSANPVYQEVTQTLNSLWSLVDAANGIMSFLVGGMIGTDDSLHEYYGAPSSVWTRYDIPTTSAATSGSNVINVTLTMFNKTATRLPEAFFLRFNASGGGEALPTWRADKLESWVDPFDVVMGGNKYHHAVGRRGIQATQMSKTGTNSSLLIGTPDAAISSWGHPRGLPTPTTEDADPSEGGGYMLINNMWGTNYPMWYPFSPENANIVHHFSLTME